MNTTAKVVKKDGKWMGEVLRSEACAHCGACEHGQREARYYPLGEGDWHEGDSVTITIGDEGAFSASAMAYGIPLSGLLIGLFAPLAFGLGDIWQIVGALVGVAAGYLVLRKLEPRLARSGKYTPHCAGRIGQGGV